MDFWSPVFKQNSRGVRKIIYIVWEQISFKIDTGADVNAVPPGIATTLRTATPSMIKLYGAGGQPLNVLGKLTAVLRCGENSFRDELYVMESLWQGSPWMSSKFGFEACATSTANHGRSTREVQSEVPWTIHWSWRNARRIPDQAQYRGQSNIRQYFPQITRQGQGPAKRHGEERHYPKSGRANHMVLSDGSTVPKSNGEVRICVDVTSLNKTVEREILIFPSVEETLGRLSGASQVFFRNWMQKPDFDRSNSLKIHNCSQHS